jgi:hypothetical protein
MMPTELVQSDVATRPTTAGRVVFIFLVTRITSAFNPNLDSSSTMRDGQNSLVHLSPVTPLQVRVRGTSSLSLSCLPPTKDTFDPLFIFPQ